MELNIPAIALALIPLNVGLVSIAKTAFDSKWAPFLSIFFGILLACLIPYSGWREIILDGIVIGLSASGLYSGTKALVA